MLMLRSSVMLQERHEMPGPLPVLVSTLLIFLTLIFLLLAFLTLFIRLL